MPTIQFALNDFQHLLGKKVSIKEFEELALEYAKAEVEGYDQKTDHVKLSLDDTNTPYLWCVEGLARYFQGVLGKKSGLAQLNIKKSSHTINVDQKVKTIRPYIAAFIATKGKIDEYLLEQLVQLQEKYCDGYGRRREKVSIGLYSQKRITWPVTYTTVAPKEITFEPLDLPGAHTPAQILEHHPKGKQHGWILKKFKEYPLLIDNKKQVLSLVPIINSNFTGKLEVGDTELLFEATGTDSDAVNLAANIFAQNLHERGFEISSITIKDEKTLVTPHDFKETITIPHDKIVERLGLDISKSEMKQLLEKARYKVVGNTVHVPHYRRDILHWADILEDVAIMYGFSNIESSAITSYTTGSRLEESKLADAAREVVIGLGYQELLSPILSNKEYLEGRMQLHESDAVEIENIMSETYSAVRTWIIPNLLDALSQNKHREYPQKVFEEGLVVVNLENKRKIALATSHSNADFTEIKQAADVLLTSLGISYRIEAIQHPSFIAGRVGAVKVDGKQIGIIGELHPSVLASWNLEMPTSALELDLDYSQSTSKK